MRRLGRLRGWIFICEKLERPCGGMFELGVEKLGGNMTFDTVRDDAGLGEAEGSGMSTIPQPKKEGELPNKHGQNAVPAKVPAGV